MELHESWMMKNMFRGAWQWTLVIAFIAFVPPIVLACTPCFLRIFTESQNSPEIKELTEDLPLIVITYWSGLLGAILEQIYDTTNHGTSTTAPLNNLSITAPRLFLGGIIGVASFIFIKSHIILHLFYPALIVSALPNEPQAAHPNEQQALVSYHSLVAIALISGLIGQSLIKKIKDGAKESDREK
jgi:hypothetical protein